MNMLYLLLVGILLPFIATLAACNDLVTFKIYNWINGLLILLFIPASIAAGFTMDQYLNSLMAFGIVLAGGMLIFALKWMGGGDVKFAAAIALWFGWTPVLGEYFIYTMIFGGILSIALLQFRAFPLPLSLAKYQWLQNLHNPKGDVPYGIALASGVLCVLPQSAWFKPFLL